MEDIDVIAIMGTCAPARSRYAAWVAEATGRMLVPAPRLSLAMDPVAEAAALVPWAYAHPGAVVDFPSTTRPAEVVEQFAEQGSDLRLTGIVCVVDAAHLIADLQRDTYAARWVRGPDGAPATQYTAHADFTVMQLEYASMIVLVEWERLSTPELSTAMALVSSLNARARLRLDNVNPVVPESGDPREIARDRPGWASVLDGEHDPHMTDPRVSAMRYERLRPFHPDRLQSVLDGRIEPGEFGTVIRSAGLCRFATRPGIVGKWMHVGRMISFEPLAAGGGIASGSGSEAGMLALGQDLAVIGLDLDVPALAAALDSALLSDCELAEGPTNWATYADPFPAWQEVGSRDR